MPTQRPAPTTVRSKRRQPAHFKAPRPLAGSIPTPPARAPERPRVPAESAADGRSRELAQELHDELGSVLTAARLDVAWLRLHGDDPAEALQTRLKRLEALLLEGHARLRQVVHGLYPSALEQFGLPAALEMLISEQDGRFNGSLRADISAQAQVDGPAALALYRCAQESLTNLHRHARARQARITLTRLGDRVQLQIRDDGCGFDPDGVGCDHHGLDGMRARLRAAGGELAVESRPGQGTCITASVGAPTAH